MLDSQVIKTFNGKLNFFEQEYNVSTKYELFSHLGPIELVCKPFNSFISKCFRKNVVENENWPREPRNGWVMHSNFPEKINDLVRGMVVVKYLDGINLIDKKFQELAKNIFAVRSYYEARDNGYYSAHFYFTGKASVSKKDWEKYETPVSLEIQVTTQLQEVIKKLLHGYYQIQRDLPRKPREKWQWDYKSDEFSANYLGHILHYIEGLILDVRDKRSK